MHELKALEHPQTLITASMNVVMNYSPGKPHICIIVHSNPCYGIFLFSQKYSLVKSLKCQYVTN